MRRYKMLRFPGFRMKALTLSYDDGVRADCMLMDILNRYGIKCTFNLNSGWFAEKEGEFRLTANEAKKYIREADTRLLYMAKSIFLFPRFPKKLQ